MGSDSCRGKYSAKIRVINSLSPKSTTENGVQEITRSTPFNFRVSETSEEEISQRQMQGRDQRVTSSPLTKLYDTHLSRDMSSCLFDEYSLRITLRTT